MKKLIFFTFAICLLVPSIFMLTGCGDEESAHNHNFSQEWSSDDTHHWYACEGDCEEKADYDEHRWDAGVQVQAPTCTENGSTRYTCQDCAKQKFEPIVASHDFGGVSYVWAENNSTCTATRVCASDPAHIDTETVTAVPQITQEQSCVSVEITRFTATFENSAFDEQIKENVQTKAIDTEKHSFDRVSYVWSEDNSTCTARRVCLHNETHFEEEVATATPQEIQALSCIQDEITSFSVVFENPAFAPQSKENITTEVRTGHNFGATTYDWEGVNSCTGTRVCTNTNCTHEESETTMNIQPQIVQDQSCVNDELTTYTAEFASANFATQTKENIKTQDRLGHDFANGVYITTDADQHWKKCSRCEEQDTENKEAHDYTGDWVTDGTHHWKECEDCGRIQEKIAHAFNQEIQSAEYLKVSATCESAGEYYYSCVCGEKGETSFETARLAHNYKDGACEHCGATEDLNYGAYGILAVYTGSATNIVIPKYSNNGNLLTSIPENAFRYNTNIESVTLPNSIININNSAFKGCTNLQSINLGSVQVFRSGCFEDCTSLDDISVASATEFGQAVFKNCTSLSSIAIPSTVQLIDYNCFNNCSSLASIDFGTGVTTIGSYAFKDCTALQSITMPNNITTLNDKSFGGCTALTNVILSANLVGEMRSTFDDCTSLVSITIPAGVTSIGSECFDCCAKLSEVIFAEGIQLTTIGQSAFNGTALTSMTLPNTVTSVGYRAFGMCKSLTYVNFGTGLQTLESDVFFNIDALREISIPVSLEAIPASFLYYKYALTQINFSGTEAEWNALVKGAKWNHCTGEYVVMCSDSEDGLAKQTYVNVYFYTAIYNEYCSFAILPNETVSEPTAPTKANYNFVGWYASEDEGATLAESAFDFESPITANTYIYAKWEVIA